MSFNNLSILGKLLANKGECDGNNREAKSSFNARTRQSQPLSPLEFGICGKLCDFALF